MRVLTRVEPMRSNSLKFRTSNGCRSNPSDLAANSVSWAPDASTGLFGLKRNAPLRAEETASLRTSRRLAISSGLKKDDPVTFPPGRARLATMPVATASPLTVMTMGMVVVACWAARVPPVGHEDIDLETNQLSGEFRQSRVVSFGPAEVDQ